MPQDTHYESPFTKQIDSTNDFRARGTFPGAAECTSFMTDVHTFIDEREFFPTVHFAITFSTDKVGAPGSRTQSMKICNPSVYELNVRLAA